MKWIRNGSNYYLKILKINFLEKINNQNNIKYYCNTNSKTVWLYLAQGFPTGAPLGRS